MSDPNAPKPDPTWQSDPGLQRDPSPVPPSPAADPAGAAGPGPGAAAPSYGGVGKRFLARIIDGLIVGIPVSILLGLLPGVRLGGLVAGLVTGVAGFAYFVALETSRGATLGKQLLAMTVTDDAGASAISTDASVRRNWWMLLSALQGIPVIGLLAGLASLVVAIAIAATISSDPRKQGWHDKLGGTLVVDRSA